MDRKLLSTKQAAAYLGISESHMRQSRVNGKGFHHHPPLRYFKVGKCVRYQQADLDCWLEKTKVDPELFKSAPFNKKGDAHGS